MRAPLLAFSFVLGCLGLTVAAADESPPLRTQLIGGLVIVRGELLTPGGSVQANFAVDLGVPDGLTLPPDTAAGLGLKPGDVCTVHVGAETLTQVRVNEHRRANVVRGVTADHASELEQIPVAGVLGRGAFGKRTLELDLDAATLQFVSTTGDVAAGDKAVVSLPVAPDKSILTTVGGVSVGIDMLSYESQIAPGRVDELRLGRSDAAAIDFAGGDLLASDAFRPADADVALPADVMLGVRWLGRVRMTVAGGQVTLRRTRPPEPQQQEQAVFLARWRGDAAALAAFLRQTPEGRLSNDIGMTLLQLRLNDAAATPTDLQAAVDAVAASFPVDRRARRLLSLADQMIDKPAARAALVVWQLLAAAALSADADLDGRAVHEVHARQGRLALNQGDLGQARRLLISAAYGLRGDAQVNQWLGELYARSDQPRRALDRLLDAALVAEPSPMALRALDRLWDDPKARAAISVDDIDVALEGRVPNYAPPPTTRPGVRSTKLVELFTDDANRGDLGPALAFEGLRREGGPATFLAFHFGPAGNTALAASRAKFYALRGVPAVLGDGQEIDNAASDAAEAPALAARYADKLATSRAAAEPTLHVTATFAGDRIEARIELTPAAAHDGKDWRMFAFVCEKKVFAVGGNGLAVHAAVARAALGEADGQTVQPGDAPQHWTLSAETDFPTSVVRTGNAARDKRPPPVPAMRTTRPDARQCYVVVIVQDAATHRVQTSAVAPLDKAAP